VGTHKLKLNLDAGPVRTRGTQCRGYSRFFDQVYENITITGNLFVVLYKYCDMDRFSVGRTLDWFFFLPGLEL